MHNTSFNVLPAHLTPVYVASLTACRRGSKVGSKDTVYALSMMRPPVW